MARYYIALREGDEIIVDGEGWDYPSIEVACQETVRSLADLAREATRPAHRDVSNYQVSVNVRDDRGGVLEVKFAFQISRPRLDA